MGGKASPPSAASHVQRLARQARWQEERDRLRRSKDGTDQARVQLQALFGELEHALSSLDASDADIKFSIADPHAARLWSARPDGEGTTVVAYWSQPWGNTLDQSGLRVTLYRGYAAAGSQDVFAFEKPRRT
jgi:hypothetical protein